MSENYFLLNRIFTRNTFNGLIHGNIEDTYAIAIKRYVNDPKNKKNKELISEIYQELNKSYRNEYFYKNTLLNKLLLGVHSPKTTTALAEVPISKSKADFVLINGKAVVYEIKTDLDNFDRLPSQLNDYYKAFNYVAVITSETNFKTIEKNLNGTAVGIYILTKRNNLSERKKPIEDNSHLDINVIFKLLHKKEYENILLNYYGKLPETSQFKYYNACCELFCNINILEAYKFALKELKKRNYIDYELYATVPYELKYLAYFSNLKTNHYKELYNFLECKFGG